MQATTTLNVIGLLNCPTATWIRGKKEIFKPITIEEIVIFMIKLQNFPWV